MWISSVFLSNEGVIAFLFVHGDIFAGEDCWKYVALHVCR